MTATRQKTTKAASGPAEMQGLLWSGAPQDWAELSAVQGIPAHHLAHDLARVGRGTRVLDIGCGSGEGLVLTLLRGAAPAGIDIAPGLVELARQRVPTADLRVGDMQDLPYKDQSFDAAVFVNTLMFPPDRRKAAQEAYRVLRPGGRVAVAAWAEPERCQLAVLMEAVMRILPEKPPGDGPFVLGPKEATTDLLKEAGFGVLEQEEITLPLRWWDEASLLGGMMATGPVQGAVRAVGEKAVVRALSEAAEGFRRPDGAYRFDNVLRCVAAERRD